jgi:NAD(P)-dependent dehydrogenase (short-subunit alcohol dehydrogenase family)
MGLLSGKHAAITGGAAGIGHAIAKELSAAGAKITILARNFERAQKAADALPLAQAIAVDVTDAQSVNRAFETCCKDNLDILVNNAGAAKSASFEKTDLDLWQSMLAVNLTGPFLCAQAALPRLKAAPRGHIINIASTSGLKGYAYTAAYSAAKHGVVGLTRSLGLELAETNIQVNAVCPGFTDTDLVQGSIDTIAAKTGRTKEEALAELTQHNPQGKLIDPSEIAATVLWICTSAPPSLTGQAIVLAGGEVM